MARQERSLSGKVVAITGGARGIGRATAADLVREGAKVAIGDLDPAVAEQTAAELGGGTKAYQLDVTDRDSFASFLEAVIADLGPLDVLINNAGIMQLGSFVEEDDATAARQIDINLHGVIYGTKLALPAMLARRSGHIVNIASQAGKWGYPGGATYSATKHAVVGVTEAVRAENRRSGVDFSIVMPVVVNTELSAGVKGARLVPNIEAEDVAAAIVGALKRTRVEVHVPRYMGPMLNVLAMLPRGVRELIARLLGSDKVLTDLDSAKRSKYEERASHSEPSREKIAS